jgi:Zn finger protein HypA/HybF involved in hydrogenase expression
MALTLNPQLVQLANTMRSRTAVQTMGPDQFAAEGECEDCGYADLMSFEMVDFDEARAECPNCESEVTKIVE